jgi:predicted acetyltransferase
MTQFEIRPIEAHEIEAYAACQAAAFGSRYPADRLELLAKELELERTLGVFDSTELIGTSSSFLSAMTLPGLVRSAVAAVTDVSVTPTHRRRGILTAMMRRQLDDMHSNNEAMAVLYSSEGAIYGRYGYGPASFAANYLMDKRLCRLKDSIATVPGGGDGSVRLIERDQAMEAFPLVFKAYVPTRVGELERPEGEWVEMLGDVSSPAMGHRFYVCYEHGGRIDGYALYRVAGIDPSDHWRRGVYLEEMCSLSSAAYRSLWSYLLGVDLTEELRTTGRPVDEPLRYMLEDQRQLRTARWSDRSWVRLVDLPRALELRRYEDEGGLVFEVSDPFCTWNEGRFAVYADGDGIASVARTKAAADIVLGADVLSSLYFGAVAFSTMAEAGRLDARSEQALQTADLMFAARRPPFCTTHF